MLVAMIIAAVLAYFVAGAFVGGVAITATGKILLGVMGMITGGICSDVSLEARSGGHEFYGDIFEIANILLQTYAFDELMQGIAEGISSIGDKIRSTDYLPMQSKKGGAYVGNGKASGTPEATVETSNKNSIGNEEILKGKGVKYPKVYVKDYGEVPFSEGPYTPNDSITLRGSFTESYKKEFKEWWMKQERMARRQRKYSSYKASF